MKREKRKQSEEFLEPQKMLRLYSMGAFPMAESGSSDIIEWYMPEQRTIIPLGSFHVPRSLRKFMEQWEYEVYYDRDFDSVVRHCSNRAQTWISPKLIEAYRRLLEMGHIHTVEIYRNGNLTGGLYGVTYQGAFFGESMFSLESQASKVALVHLVRRLTEKKFLLLDVQMMTEHLKMFGAVEISFNEYASLLRVSSIVDAEFN